MNSFLQECPVLDERERIAVAFRRGHGEQDALAVAETS
jgi:hypothetical protein